MLKLLLIAAILAPAVLGQGFDAIVRQCRNGAALPQTVNVNGCTTSPCQITNGQPLRISAGGITSPVDTSSLEAYTVLRVAGVKIPFSMPSGLRNACAIGTLPGTCPVSAGQVFDYQLDIPSPLLPVIAGPVEVEFGLRGDLGAAEACFEFDATIFY